jgi:hypothetical protein
LRDSAGGGVTRSKQNKQNGGVPTAETNESDGIPQLNCVLTIKPVTFGRRTIGQP